MPAPGFPTLVVAIFITLLCLGNILLSVSAIDPQVSNYSPEEYGPGSHIVSGNPWGVVFEETVAVGWSLERVELLLGDRWSITARLTIDEMIDEIATTANEPILFLGNEQMKIPSNSREIRAFTFGVGVEYEKKPWLANGIDPSKSVIPRLHGVEGTFLFRGSPLQGDAQLAEVIEIEQTQMKEYPNSVFRSTEKHANVTFMQQHPRIRGTSQVTLIISDHVVSMLAPHVKNNTRTIMLGVSLLSTGTGTSAYETDFIFSGLVRVQELQRPGLTNQSNQVNQLIRIQQDTPIIRSFSAITSTRYSFLSHTSVQIIETLSNDVSGREAIPTFNYIAVISFGLEDGITSPQVQMLPSARFAIGPAMTTIDSSRWKAFSCPFAVELTGCATALVPADAPFCDTEPIMTNGRIVAFRTRVQLGHHTTQPRLGDSVFIRIPLSAKDISDNSTIQTFINIQTPLQASSVRCGAVIVQAPARDTEVDPIVMTLYSGTMLTPMTFGTNDAPLVPSTIAIPQVASSVSNLHARGILDSLVTIALIGDDAVFPMLALNIVEMVDLISIHVRSESLYVILDNLIRTGAAYEVEYTNQHISMSAQFESLCLNTAFRGGTIRDSPACARRDLMRNGLVLEPTHTHIAIEQSVDIDWFNKLFNDVSTDNEIAGSFVEKVYQNLNPNTRFRRIIWVDSTYEWPQTSQGSVGASSDHMILLASFQMKDGFATAQ
jgi:hypothetical protein